LNAEGWTSSASALGQGRDVCVRSEKDQTGGVATAFAVEHGGSLKTGELILGSAQAGSTREDFREEWQTRCLWAHFTFELEHS
jgi:hypothetical protein